MAVADTTAERIDSQGLRGAAWPLATAAAAALATIVVAVRSPYQTASYGFCPVLALTGHACPTCGGLRAVHELTQLDLTAAWSMNALVVLAVPLAVVLWVSWLVRAFRGGPRLEVPRAVPWLALAGFLLFGVLRNLPPLLPGLTPWLG